MITLEDRNLPEIARERVLKPRDDDGRPPAISTRRSTPTTKVRREVLDTLLGTDAAAAPTSTRSGRRTRSARRFLSTLVHVSSALQRSRTALKLMRQLLVDRRDDAAPRRNWCRSATSTT